MSIDLIILVLLCATSIQCYYNCGYYRWKHRNYLYKSKFRFCRQSLSVPQVYAIRPGTCPKERTSCIVPMNYCFTKRYQCFGDNNCPQGYKCCWDSCFWHKVCKRIKLYPGISSNCTSTIRYDTTTTRIGTTTISPTFTPISSTFSTLTTLTSTEASSTTVNTSPSTTTVQTTILEDSTTSTESTIQTTNTSPVYTSVFSTFSTPTTFASTTEKSNDNTSPSITTIRSTTLKDSTAATIKIANTKSTTTETSTVPSTTRNIVDDTDDDEDGEKSGYTELPDLE